MANTKLRQKKALAKIDHTFEGTRARVKEVIENFVPGNHPYLVWTNAEKELADKSLVKRALEGIMPTTALYKAMTLDEFNLGILMNDGLNDMYKTFSIDLSVKIQKEYNCETESRKATAHLAAHSYCRILEIQRKMNGYLELGTINERGIGYLNVLSKELDRAQRHYYNAIQTLSMAGQTPMKITVKADQANFGQNVLVQQKNEII